MFGIQHFGTFVFAVVLFLVIPGPGTLAMISATRAGELPGGLSAVAGLMLGDQVIMWAALAGIATILQGNPALFVLLRLVGSGYLLFLGCRLLFSRHQTIENAAVPMRRFFVQALMITLSNPKTVVFYFAFFPTFLDPESQRGFQTLACMALTVAILEAAYGFSVVTLTHHFFQRMRSSSLSWLMASRIGGLAMIGFALRLAV